MQPRERSRAADGYRFDTRCHVVGDRPGDLVLVGRLAPQYDVILCEEHCYCEKTKLFFHMFFFSRRSE